MQAALRAARVGSALTRRATGNPQSGMQRHEFFASARETDRSSSLPSRKEEWGRFAWTMDSESLTVLPASRVLRKESSAGSATRLGSNAGTLVGPAEMCGVVQERAQDVKLKSNPVAVCDAEGCDQPRTHSRQRRSGEGETRIRLPPHHRRLCFSFPFL